jgi:hypothetical protein
MEDPANEYTRTFTLPPLRLLKRLPQAEEVAEKTSSSARPRGAPVMVLSDLPHQRVTEPRPEDSAAVIVFQQPLKPGHVLYVPDSRRHRL